MLGDQAIADSFTIPGHYFQDEPEVFQKLSFVYYANHLLKYYDQEYVRVYSSPILVDVGRNILAKYRSHLKLQETPVPLKYRLYSAHDTTLTPILLNLGLIDRGCVIAQAQFLKDFKCKQFVFPEVGSALTWELVEVGAIEHYVRTSFNGKHINFCALTKEQMRPGDREGLSPKYDCSLRDFDQRIADLTVRNWLQLCHNIDQEKTPDLAAISRRVWERK